MMFIFRIKILIILSATFTLFACISGGGDGSDENNNNPINQETSYNNIDPSVDNGNFVSTAQQSVLGYVFFDKNGTIVTFKQSFTEFGEEFEKTANEWLNLPKGDIFVSFQDCGISNAFYDPENVEIIMCYDLLIEFIQFYGENNTKSSQAFLFTFFHELGHALVDQLDLPVIGNQESAVDAFAAIAMVDSGIAEAAVFAGFFFLNSGSSWTSEHEMGSNRLGNLACWAIGGAPYLLLDDSIRNLAEQLYEAGRNCPAEYEQQRNSVNTLLEPFEKI